MSYRGRFAPSPTGLLHFGSLVAALGSWLCARHAGGEWLVRIEDVDPPREVPGSARMILATLEAFGLRADAPPVYQSTRHGLYEKALARLREDGHAFPCWCSRGALAAGDGIHRDGRCVDPADPSRPCAWRLRVPDLDIAFVDGLQGSLRQNLRDVAGDFVLRRAEGFWAYQLACVVDDAAQGMTDIVRGEDLLDSTPRQIYLQRLLGLPVPRHLHLPLVLDGVGRKLSKSAADLPIDPTDPMPALRRGLAALGLGNSHSPQTPDALLETALGDFDPARLQRSSHLYG
jgi:glutamyl-Q tRNA(Asp) synthetase